jgi:hypothetical protein
MSSLRTKFYYYKVNAIVVHIEANWHVHLNQPNRSSPQFQTISVPLGAIHPVVFSM